MSTELSDKLRSIAVTRALPEDHPARKAATEFDTATEGYFATPQTVQVKTFLGTWARARRAYCDLTGENLI